VALFIS